MKWFLTEERILPQCHSSVINSMRCLIFSLFLTSPLFAQSAAGPQEEFFEKKIRPLLLTHCMECHSEKKVKGQLRMDSRASLLKGGETGPAVVPGKPEASLLIKAVHYKSEELKMPPKGKLKDSEIADLEKWIKEGAVWPHSATGETKTDPQAPLFTEEQKKFWAFQPIQKPQPPQVKNAAWVKTPIDAFILAELEKKNLKPNTPAEKRVLLRRVTYNLTGLPPTPEETQAFLNDSSPDSWSKVIDRLLNSPAYGERWGRHWLDVARYADSNGLDENTAFGNAWRYRDYVIKSFNADKPYNEFILEQIAGDLLPDAHQNPDRLTATGFLSLGPKLLAEPDKQKMKLDIADEQLDTIGKSILGLTLGCARCHDHKFDPIPTRDYYSLLSIFTSTRTMENLSTVAKTYERPLPNSENPKLKAERDARLKIATDALNQFTANPPAGFWAPLVKLLELKQAVEKIRAEIPKPIMVLAVAENPQYPEVKADGKARNLFVQIRGNYLTPGEEAPLILPRILAGENQTPLLPSNNDPLPLQTNETRYGSSRPSSGRLELARWLSDPKNPLTARVIVNRVWQHHFGEGLVRSPDNFGKLGDRPSHPELLDWLASKFIEEGWSFKKLHRLILSSAVYQMSSAAHPEAFLIDPDNRLLSRYPRRRLEAEAIRDGILAVSGKLDRTLGGSLLYNGNFSYVSTNPTTDQQRYDHNRRSVYIPIIRGVLFDFFQAYDFPEPSVPNGKRATTVVSSQTLFMLNNPFVEKQARELATRLISQSASIEDRLQKVYELAFCRSITSEEIAKVKSSLQEWDRKLEAREKDGKKRELEVWTFFCKTLFATNEFIYLD